MSLSNTDLARDAKLYADLASAALDDSKRRANHADAELDIRRAEVYARLAQASALAG